MARPYVRHGMTAVIRTYRARGMSVVDGRSKLGRQMKAWRQEMEEHLGDRLTPPMASLLDASEVTRAILLEVDAALMKGGADRSFIVNRKSRRLTNLALQRLHLAEGHRKDMIAFGLEPKHAPVLDLDTHLRERYGAKKGRSRANKKPGCATRKTVPGSPDPSSPDIVPLEPRAPPTMPPEGCLYPTSKETP